MYGARGRSGNGNFPDGPLVEEEQNVLKKKKKYSLVLWIYTADTRDKMTIFQIHQGYTYGRVGFFFSSVNKRSIRNLAIRTIINTQLNLLRKPRK